MGTLRIHFLDSRKLPYVSKIWLDKIEEEFELLVFDHHTDMQMLCLGISCPAAVGFRLLWIQIRV